MSKKVKVYAPNTAFNGNVGGVQFASGVGEVDEASPLVAGYFKRRGYGIGSKPAATEPAHQDSREATAPHVVGTPLRDAAVDPQPQDFLAPINAGKADPHGPEVVAPQIHADGPKGIKPGDVLVHDPARQDTAESALAQAVLVEGQDKQIAVPAAATPIDRSPEAEAARHLTPPSESPVAVEMPKRNGAKAAWVEYAVAQGLSREEAEDMSRADLAAKYSEDSGE